MPMNIEIIPPISGPAYGMTFITPMMRPMSSALSVFMPKSIITIEMTIMSIMLSVSIPVK